MIFWIINRKVCTQFFFGIVFLVSFFCGCKKLIEIPTPETELTRKNVFKNDATVLAAITDVYTNMSSGTRPFTIGPLSICEGLYADELTSFASSTAGSGLPDFYFNGIVPTNSIVTSIWGDSYKNIYACNMIIENLEQAQGVSSNMKNQIIGEALFLRAFFHFYLVNLFGDVPLIVTSNYQNNSLVNRTPEADIYKQIINDLLESKALLIDNYPSVGRVRPNKAAAASLLARTYLYSKQYALAEEQSSEIINNNTQYLLHDDLNQVFLNTSQEAIWQLLPNGGLDNYTYEGSIFILQVPPRNIALRNDLALAFEVNDLRKSSWIDTIQSSSGLTTWYFPFKYKQNHLNASGSEYSMVLRLAEQYLIRAESRAKLNNLSGAEDDINSIRNRAGLDSIKNASQSALIDAVENERRFELFTEWGHRFFDLKRNDRLDVVLGASKPNWERFKQLLPIPQSELRLNSNLQPQNSGY